MATVTAVTKVTISFASTLDGHQYPQGSIYSVYNDFTSRLYAKAATDPFYFLGALSTVNYTFDSDQQPTSVTYTVEGSLYAKRILDIAKQTTY